MKHLFTTDVAQGSLVARQYTIYGADTHYRIRVTVAERTEKKQKMLICVHPLMKVVSLAMRVFAERVRSA